MKFIGLNKEKMFNYCGEIPIPRSKVGLYENKMNFTIGICPKRFDIFYSVAI